MVKQNSRPGDFTGQAKAKLAKEHQEEVAKRGDELAMMEAAEAEAAQNRVTDYTAGSAQPVILDSVEDLMAAEQELQMDPAEITVLEAPHRTIRINSDLDSVTIGVGQHYSFREGEKYKVPAQVAEHLEEKGFVWH